MRDKSRQPPEEDLARRLQIELDGIQAPGVSAVPGGPEQVGFPPGLVEETARIFFEFWEQNAQGQGRAPLRWEQLAARHQTAWRKITRIGLTMATQVLLQDIDEYFDKSNGDMGAAFSRALHRYAENVLKIKMRK